MMEICVAVHPIRIPRSTIHWLGPSDLLLQLSPARRPQLLQQILGVPRSSCKCIPPMPCAAKAMSKSTGAGKSGGPPSAWTLSDAAKCSSGAKLNGTTGGAAVLRAPAPACSAMPARKTTVPVRLSILDPMGPSCPFSDNHIRKLWKGAELMMSSSRRPLNILKMITLGIALEWLPLQQLVKTSAAQHGLL